MQAELDELDERLLQARQLLEAACQQSGAA